MRIILLFFFLCLTNLSFAQEEGYDNYEEPAEDEISRVYFLEGYFSMYAPLAPFSEKIEKALPAAYAIEIFHNFTLIHDDIMGSDHCPVSLELSVAG